MCAYKNFTKLISSLICTGIIASSANGQENTTLPQSRLSQNYETAIGARLTNGLTLKHFINPSSAVEAILTLGYNPILLTGLYEKHLDITFAPGLKWVFGIGGHVGFFGYRGCYYWMVYDYGNRVFYVRSPNTTVSVAGVDLMLGLDYKLKYVPINLSLDVKPFIDFYNGTYGYFDGALSARFTF